MTDKHQPFISNSFIANSTAIAFVGGIVQLLFSAWWVFTIPAFLIGYFRKGTFTAGFLAMFLLWGGYAWQIDYATDSILTQKIANLFQLPYPGLMILVSAIIGGLLGGLATSSGNALQDLVHDLSKKEETVAE